MRTMRASPMRSRSGARPSCDGFNQRDAWRSFMGPVKSANQGPAFALRASAGKPHRAPRFGGQAPPRSALRRASLSTLSRVDELPVFELQLIQTVVDPAVREQLLMSTRFAKLTLVEHQNPVHILDGRQTVRDG